MGEWGAMTSRRRGMQGYGNGPERSNGSAHDARSLGGGAYDTEPAQRRSGRVRRRPYAESGGGPEMDRCLHVTGTSLGHDAGTIRGPRGSAPVMAAPGGEGSGRSNRSVHDPM